MSKKFIKNKEDFSCDFCKTEVKGNGYTNHCPCCLHSKHVDVNPGDRASVCLGLMKPTHVEGTQKEYLITQVCSICGHKRKNKASEQDSIDALVAVVKKVAAKTTGRFGR
jgi:RNHCP domain